MDYGFSDIVIVNINVFSVLLIKRKIKTMALKNFQNRPDTNSFLNGVVSRVSFHRKPGRLGFILMIPTVVFHVIPVASHSFTVELCGVNNTQNAISIFCYLNKFPGTPLFSIHLYWHENMRMNRSDLSEATKMLFVQMPVT